MEYEVFKEQEESEIVDFDLLKYLIKHYYLIGIKNDNEDWYTIRQYKDLPIQVMIDDKEVSINYWDLYITECWIWGEHYKYVLPHMHTEEQLKEFLKLAKIEYED